jgi:hypothetical protein
MWCSQKFAGENMTEPNGMADSGGAMDFSDSRFTVKDKLQVARSPVWTWGSAVGIWIPALAWILGLLAVGRLAMTPAARGYEVSAYSAMPLLFWYCLLFSSLLHIVAVARVCFRRKPASSDQILAVFGVAGLVVNTLVVILLPYFRGYHIIRGDLGSHIAYSGLIAGEQSIRRQVFYPATYALVQIIHTVMGLGLRDLWHIGSAAAHILYVLACLLVAKKLFVDRRSLWFAGLVAAIPVAGAYLRVFSPASVSVQMLPLVVYLYVSSRSGGSWRFNLLLVLVLVMLPFVHPLTALMGILWLTLLEVAMRLFDKNDADKPSVAMTPSLILAITWFTWFSSFTLWNRSVRNVVDWLTGEANTQLGKVSYLIDRSGLSRLDTALLVLKQENGIILYVGLALATLLLCHLAANKSGPRCVPSRHLRPLYVVLIASIIAAVGALVGPFGELDFYRFSRFLVPWATIIIASVPVMGSALVVARGGRLLGPLVTCMLIVVAIGGILALHPSPYVFLPNDQVPEQDLACMRWVYQQGDGREIRGIWGTARLGEIALGEQLGDSLPGAYHLLPEHFGYDRAFQVAQTLEKPAYMLITEYDRVSVLDVWTSVNKFTPEEFARLKTDPSIVLLYSNGECEVWATRP